MLCAILCYAMLTTVTHSTLHVTRGDENQAVTVFAITDSIGLLSEQSQPSSSPPCWRQAAIRSVRGDSHAECGSQERGWIGYSCDCRPIADSDRGQAPDTAELGGSQLEACRRGVPVIGVDTDRVILHAVSCTAISSCVGIRSCGEGNLEGVVVS